MAFFIVHSQWAQIYLHHKLIACLILSQLGSADYSATLFKLCILSLQYMTSPTATPYQLIACVKLRQRREYKCVPTSSNICTRYKVVDWTDILNPIEIEGFNKWSRGRKSLPPFLGLRNLHIETVYKSIQLRHPF